MAPSARAPGLLAVVAVLCLASSPLAVRALVPSTCPVSAKVDTSCYCSGGCTNPSGPIVSTPVLVDQGTDTICVTLSGTCSGNVAGLYQNFAGASCTANANFVFYTGFSQSDCATAESLGAGLNVSAYFCTTTCVGWGASCAPSPDARAAGATPWARPTRRRRPARRRRRRAAARFLRGHWLSRQPFRQPSLQHSSSKGQLSGVVSTVRRRLCVHTRVRHVLCL